MQRRWYIFFLMVFFSYMLNACSSESEPRPHLLSNDSDEHVLAELKTAPVRAFPNTPDDSHDIQLLIQYDRDFNIMSDAMEDELLALQAQGTLTDQFSDQRKLENIQTALSMLKALNLKTAQGRYIKDLLSDYWQSQQHILQQEKNLSEPLSSQRHVKDLGIFLQAHEQLEYWSKQLQETSAARPIEQPQPK